MKNQFGYFIVDSFGNIGGQLGLSVRNLDGSGTEWCYIAHKNASTWHTCKSLAYAEVEKLQALNEIAQIPGLNWQVVYANKNDFPEYHRECFGFDSVIINHDIPQGQISKFRKAVNLIKKKYNPIFRGIEKDFRSLSA